MLLLVFFLGSEISTAANLACDHLLSHSTVERVDLHRQWGVKLIKDSNPAWTDSRYLQEILNYSRPEITNYGGAGASIYREFERRLKSHVDGSIENLATSGTDANSMLFEYARQICKERTRSYCHSGRFLTLGPVYGGAHGRLTEIMESRDHLIAPYIEPGKVLSESELADQARKEMTFLESLRNRILEDTGLGGIFIEPVSFAAAGLRVYRTEFLLQLRELADELKVPIFADEILMGGGRTGHFWGFQRYDGFLPDVITFGKGLVVSGVFRIAREKYGSQEAPLRNIFPFYNRRLQVTSYGSPLALVQAHNVLRAIEEQNLIENVRRQSASFHGALTQLGRNQNQVPTVLPRTVGFVAEFPSGRLNRDYFSTVLPNRLMAPMDLSNEEIELFFR